MKDEEWAVVEPALRPARREDNRGRPRCNTRAVLNGVLCVSGTGAHWRELPEWYPAYQTCHRRFQQWIRTGKLERALKLLATLLHEQGKLNLDEAFVDATFASSKKGGFRSVPPAAARAPKSSLSPLVTVSLSPDPCNALARRNAHLSKKCLPEASSCELPAQLIGDKAYQPLMQQMGLVDTEPLWSLLDGKGTQQMMRSVMGQAAQLADYETIRKRLTSSRYSMNFDNGVKFNLAVVTPDTFTAATMSSLMNAAALFEKTSGSAVEKQAIDNTDITSNAGTLNVRFSALDSQFATLLKSSLFQTVVH